MEEGLQPGVIGGKDAVTGGCHHRTPPPNFPMLMAVPKGQMHLQAEPVSMGSCSPVIKSISSAVRCLASHPGSAPHLSYNFCKLTNFCKPHYLCLERETEYHSLVRKGNESIYFLECEHESLNTFLLRISYVLGSIQGLGLQQGTDFPTFVKLTL